MSDSLVGLTVLDVARRYRVGPDKIRSWIRSGELAAINTASSAVGRPRFVIPADALADFEKRRAAAKPKAKASRQRKVESRDFYPD